MTVNLDPSLTVSAVAEKKWLPKQTRVAVLFQRFGPYHHARLNAVGRLMPVWGLEACGMEDTYAWNKVEEAGAFARITLTERDTGDRRWQRELRKKLWKALTEIKPTVVVIPGWASADSLNALSWCTKTTTPVVVMSESTTWDEPRVFWKEWIKARLVKLCVAGLAGGTPHADYLVQLGLPRERIFPGYDIVDNDFFAAKAAEVKGKDAEVRKLLDLPRKYFLASARFIEKKNLPGLIEAYARYRQLAQSSEIGNRKSEIWDLVLLGDGPLQSSILDLRLSLGLEHCVHLPGFKQYDELPAYLGLAGAFVHVSSTEQWGLVVNEAMASSLPVLVSRRCGCAVDLVREGVNGFTFDHRDVNAIAGLMFKISEPGFPLIDFGAQSKRIISAWGPERFASGLQEAVAVAQNRPQSRAGFIDRLLLRLVHMSMASGLLKS